MSQVDILQSVFFLIVAGALQSGIAIAEQELSSHMNGRSVLHYMAGKHKTGVWIYDAVFFHSEIPFKNTLLSLGSPSQG